MRFPEFNDEWKICSLSDYGTIITGTTPPTSDAENYVEKGFLWASPVDIGDNKFIETTKTTLSPRGFDMTRRLPPYSVLVVCIGSTIGKMAMARTTMATNQQINSIIVSEKYSPEFVYYAINSRFPKYLTSIAVQAVPIISKSAFEKLESFYPSLIEQERIASFLSLLDERIETQRQIIKEHKILKRATIQEVFSRIREWDSLEHLVDRGAILLKRGEIIPKSEYSSTNQYPVYSSSVRNKGLMGYTDKFMFDDERITWSIDGGGDLFYRHPHQYSVTNVCGILEILGKYDYRFLCAMLQIQHSRLNFDYQTKAHPSVIVKLYKVPRVHFEQQVHYGELFVTIDERIEVEEKLLQKYEEQKRYLLRKMFV